MQGAQQLAVKRKADAETVCPAKKAKDASQDTQSREWRYAHTHTHTLMRVRGFFFFSL
jgi:hypothetical protein